MSGWFKKSPKYLYHYTNNPSRILKNGFTITDKQPYVYLTNKSNLSPLQAQIDLALPANRLFPTSILKVNVKGMHPSMIRKATGNLPGMGAGGGTEYIFNQGIPASLIKQIK